VRKRTLLTSQVLLLCSVLVAACVCVPPRPDVVHTVLVTQEVITTAQLPSRPTPRPVTPALVDIPAAAWWRVIGEPYEEAGRPYVSYPMIDDGVWGGVPLGGLGAGAIGHTYRGDFSRWHLDLGTHRFETVAANQFSVYVQQGDERQAHVLSPIRPSSLKAWSWDMPVGAGTYYGLFPKAWFVYDWNALPVNMVQKQFSPVIPGNYQESSYPVGVFEWTVENPTDEPLTVGVMLSWQNLVGQIWGMRLVGGKYNYAVSEDGLTGIVLTREGGDVTEEWDGSFAIVAPKQDGVQVSYQSRFEAVDGADVWEDFSADGVLANADDRTPAGESEPIAGALAVTVQLAPGEIKTFPMALAWDFPITEFDGGTQWYKRYTRFFGTSGRDAWAIAADALAHYPEWEAEIDAWQRPILDDTDRPEWYKTALFNELYYLVDGGTVWENGMVGGEPPADGIGKFAYMETFDYPFYNTFDVHFYGSFALVQLWPELQKSLIRDFVATVPMEDTELVEIGFTGQHVPRKSAGAVPHDLGGPEEDPWLRVNWYSWQDINIWKDLNAKFVLQLWRDYVFTGDETLVEDGWPAVVQALDYLKAFDRDGDGLPEHDGIPDQTYDTWPMTGPSAYGGSLWLAALEAAIEMGEIVGDEAQVTIYAGWLEAGKVSFEEKLWNGQYYDYDASEGPYSDSIMADQLAGQWYADATGLPPIVPVEHSLSALQTIYEYNVLRFQGGQMGAVNGMRPDGRIDTSGDQSQEVWTGTTYGLAALMHHQGLEDEAWATAWGVYNVTYNRGYWFRTPEAYLADGNYRASMYMRPLSIWAIEHALNGKDP
jgi:non-lysosomal glucosylceramidase